MHPTPLEAAADTLNRLVLRCVGGWTTYDGKPHSLTCLAVHAHTDAYARTRTRARTNTRTGTLALAPSPAA